MKPLQNKYTLENKEDYTNKLKNLQLVMDEMEKREKLAKEHKTMKTLINKIKTYIKHKIHNIKMMFKLMRNAWKLNSIITWYEQHQTLPQKIRDINDNIYDIDSKVDDNYYKIEDIENQNISRRLDDIDDKIEDIGLLRNFVEDVNGEIKKLKSDEKTVNGLCKRYFELKDEIKKLKTSNNSLIHNQKKYMNDDNDYLHKPLKFKGNEGYYEWLTNKTNHDNLDKCAEEISKVYGGDVNNKDINNIKKIINKYINLSNKGDENVK